MSCTQAGTRLNLGNRIGLHAKFKCDWVQAEVKAIKLAITPLAPALAARVENIRFDADLPVEVFAQLRRALDDHSVLICPNQSLDDDAQVRFSTLFGPLEATISANPAGGSAFARQSNIDVQSGALIDAADQRMQYQKGNMQWHADSTFKPLPSLCSILSAREVPALGGDTEFASTRAAFESLSPRRQAQLASLVVEHDLIFSRRQVGFEFTPAQVAESPPARHPLVQRNPVTGRGSLLVGAHAARIAGWSDEQSRALLDELVALATRPEHRYVHQWSTGDVVIWDNRSALHRATPFDGARYRRLMQRTTVTNPGAAIDQASTVITGA